MRSSLNIVLFSILLAGISHGVQPAMAFSTSLAGTHQQMIPDTVKTLPDSVRTQALSSPADSVRRGMDSTRVQRLFRSTGRPVAVSSDTLPPERTENGREIEGPIRYEAENIQNIMSERKTILTGKARVTYQDMELRAARITVDWENENMHAEGVWDSVWVKSEKDSVRTARYTGKPEFKEAGDVLAGEVMVYDFRTKKGRVQRGRTQYEDGYYGGDVLKMVASKTVNVSDARYSTCDREENPHFHFRAKKMKIIVNDLVVAKPIVLYLGHIPVLALPFIYFPIEKGRHSGIILPRYGESTTEGRSLRGFGYYWAASDYWDVKGTLSYFERSGFLFRGDLNYHVRYHLRGSVSGSWTRKDFEYSDVSQRVWDLTINHDQTLSPTMTLRASGTFLGGNQYYRNYSANREQRLQRELRSNATLTKDFGRGRSVTVNFNQTRDLETDEIRETLPRVNFRVGRFSLIPKPQAERGKPVETRWYHNIYVNYSSDAVAERRRDQMIESAYNSETGITDTDTVYVKDRSAGWNHNIGISGSQKMFGWLSMNPSFNLVETWYTQRNKYFLDEETNRVESEIEKGFFARRTYNMSLSFSTKLYGLFRPRFFKSVQLRHVVTPSVSFSYRPDFSGSSFGYYQTVTDTTGKTNLKDRFSGGFFGGTPTGGQESMSISVQNLFQMKIGEGKEAKKFDLFNWSLGTSYNWKADQFKLGFLSSNVRANPSRDLNLSLQSTYDFYRLDEDDKRIERFYVQQFSLSDPWSVFTSRWLRLTNVSANMTVRLKGTLRTGGTASAVLPGETVGPLGGLQKIAGDRLDDIMPMGMSTDSRWDLNGTISYMQNRTNPASPVRRFWANASLNVNLTQNWRITLQTRYDIEEKEFVSQDFIFYRDLHCWEAQIYWTPVGTYKRFYFRINVKSPQLKDLKFEKGTGRTGLVGSGLSSMY